jgi:hypothetical protein
MLIVSVAFGILLAVFILVFLPHILRVALWLVVAAISLLLLAWTVGFLSIYREIFEFALFLVLPAAFAYVAWNWVTTRTQRKILRIEDDLANLQRRLSSSEVSQDGANNLKDLLVERKRLRQEISEKLRALGALRNRTEQNRP